MILETLKKNKEFSYVYRRGKTVGKRYFTLVYAKSRYGGIRAGFSVSKKVGNSVERNRVRRRLKEAVRNILPRTAGNYGIVLVARPQAKTAVFSALEKEILSAFTVAGIASVKGNPGTACST